MPSFQKAKVTLLYLVAITAAEAVTDFVSLTGGAVFYTILLIVLIVHSFFTITSASSTSKFLLALSLTPLIRLLSLFLPLAQFAPAYWYLIIYPPLFIAAWVAMRRLNFSTREVGLTFGRLQQQVPIALSGIAFGIIEYVILKPSKPLIPELTMGEGILTIFALVAGTGFVEEFIFRGVLQRASLKVLGEWGIFYVALVFAILHLIHHSAVDILFVFAVGLFFGWVVNKTGSIFGVTLSHSITNILLFLIIPLYFS